MEHIKTDTGGNEQHTIDIDARWLRNLVTVKQVHPRDVKRWRRKRWRIIGQAVMLNGAVWIYMVPKGITL